MRKRKLKEGVRNGLYQSALKYFVHMMQFNRHLQMYWLWMMRLWNSDAMFIWKDYLWVIILQTLFVLNYRILYQQVDNLLVMSKTTFYRYVGKVKN